MVVHHPHPRALSSSQPGRVLATTKRKGLGRVDWPISLFPIAILAQKVSQSLLRTGRVAEWLKATDCKSVEGFLRRFESCLSHPNRLGLKKIYAFTDSETCIRCFAWAGEPAR